jgi:hypothetical protein
MLKKSGVLLLVLLLFSMSAYAVRIDPEVKGYVYEENTEWTAENLAGSGEKVGFFPKASGSGFWETIALFDFDDDELASIDSMSIVIELDGTQTSTDDLNFNIHVIEDSWGTDFLKYKS